MSPATNNKTGRPESDGKSRSLTANEIAGLEKQGCFCADWGKVQVSGSFAVSRIRDTSFTGNIRLGSFAGEIAVEPGVILPTGIYDSHLYNCSIGDDCLISQVGRLSNYDIEAGVLIDQVRVLAVRGMTSFANGVKIEVLNEGGGRELQLYDRLSSQIAYLMVLYRHDAGFVDSLGKMIERYAESRKSDRGLIAKGTKIVNSGQILNVAVGPFVAIDGALYLEEGTVWGCEADPTFIGEGVIAKKFIIQSGSRIESSAMLSGCFVGQGVRMGKQFSAENSAFFANCEGFHGEAVSLFAGPYTVTHHKSTLLIAGLFSFYNAGSGTNQSNHMYKLGPLHQGVLERGCKTGSSSYLLWPSRVGAYTAVIGKHYSNFDSSDLPFSYITEDDGRSVITPAMNLFTVGTARDSEKWPARDRRKDADKLDLIHFDLFSPFVVAKMEKAARLLADLYENADRKNEFVSHKGIHLKRLMLKSCGQYYELGLKVALGQSVLDRITDSLKAGSLAGVRKRLSSSVAGDVSGWLDIAGLFVPASRIAKITSGVGSGALGNLDAIVKDLKDCHAGYPEARWTWFAGLLERMHGTPLTAMTPEVLGKVVSEWKEAAVKLNNMISRDASKEFSQQTMTGFGVDGDEATKKADFEAVRGTYEKNKFVKGLAEKSAAIEKTALDLQTLLSNLK